MIDLFELGEIIESKENDANYEAVVEKAKGLVESYQRAIDEGFEGASKIYEKKLEELKDSLGAKHGAKESETTDYDIKKIIKSFNPRETLLAKKYDPNPFESEDIKDIIRDKPTRPHPPVFAEGKEVSDDDIKEILDGTRPGDKIAAHQGEQLNEDVINELLEDTEPSDRIATHQGKEISFGSTVADVKRLEEKLEQANRNAKTQYDDYQWALRNNNNVYMHASNYKYAERDAQEIARDLHRAQKNLEH